MAPVLAKLTLDSRLFRLVFFKEVGVCACACMTLCMRVCMSECVSFCVYARVFVRVRPW